ERGADPPPAAPPGGRDLHRQPQVHDPLPAGRREHARGRVRGGGGRVRPVADGEGRAGEAEEAGPAGRQALTAGTWTGNPSPPIAMGGLLRFGGDMMAGPLAGKVALV